MTSPTTRTIASTAAALAGGTTTSRDLVEQALARAGDAQGEGPTHLPPAACGRGARRRRGRGLRCAARACRRPRPLAGLPISIKDLFERTRRDHEPPARACSPTIRPRRATRRSSRGCAAPGPRSSVRTTMTEFAYSGLGINPHYGTPRCPWDRATGRIPGGSSSGAAVSVTDDFALGAIGTDTGGSVRIPAAVCGIVGFKPTAARVPAATAACRCRRRSIRSGRSRTASRAAIAIDRVLAWENIDTPLPEPTPAAAITLAVPRTVLLDDLEAAGRGGIRARPRASVGGRLPPDRRRVPPLAAMQESPRRRRAPRRRAGGRSRAAIAAAEAFAWHRALLATSEPGYDPRVAKRIRRAEGISMPEYLALVALRRAPIAEMHAITRPYTAVVCPTVPIVPPALAPLRAGRCALRRNQPAHPAQHRGGQLSRRCAITLPCHEPGTAPVGLMLIGEHMGDAALLRAALTVEAILAA